MDAIKRVGQYYSIPVCDFYSESGISTLIESDKKIYTKDGCHPNKNGGRRLAKFLDKMIQYYNY